MGNIEDCEGCIIDPPYYTYTCTWFYKNEVCPCSICLIKVMCGTKCDLFESYQVKIHNLRAKVRRRK